IANHTRSLRIHRAEMRNDFLRTASYQNLRARREKSFDSFPRVSNEASARTRRFKDARRRREAGVRHRLSINVQHHASRAIHAIVIGGGNVTDPAHIARQWLPCPTFAAKNERHLGGKLSRAQKELLYAALAVGEAMADKGQIA